MWTHFPHSWACFDQNLSNCPFCFWFFLQSQQVLRWYEHSFRHREPTRAVFTYICCLMQVHYVFLLLVTDHMKGKGYFMGHYLFEEGCSRLEIEMRIGTLQLVGSVRQTHWSVASYSSWSPRAFTQTHLWVFPFFSCAIKKQTWLLALLDCSVLFCVVCGQVYEVWNLA